MSDLSKHLRSIARECVALGYASLRHNYEDAADALEAKDKEIERLRALLREAQYLLSIPDTQLPMMALNQWAQRTNAALAPAKEQP